MHLSDSSWHTPSKLRINIPIEEIDFEMSDMLIRGTDPTMFLATRVDNSYNFSRILRTVLLFVAFFNLSNPWSTLLFTLGGFLLGYGYMFIRDHFPFSTLIDLFGMIYHFLLFIIPVAVIVTAICTDSYLLIALYFISLIASFVLRFVIDIFYAKFTLHRHSVPLSIVDAKAVRVIYQYGKARRTMSFRAYYRRLISDMTESST